MCRMKQTSLDYFLEMFRLGEVGKPPQLRGHSIDQENEKSFDRSLPIRKRL